MGFPTLKRVRQHIFLLLGIFILVPLAVIWTIAGSDKLFVKAVPVEQRLVSPNETIRQKAQQELLGMDAAAKQDLADRLIPSLTQGDAFARKWAAISLALIGPPAQLAIPALLHGVSANEPDVSQACRVALSEIGTPDPQQLPALIQDLAGTQESVRCEAASSIAKLGPAAGQAIPHLINDVKASAEIPVCTGNALAALADHLPGTVPEITALLASDQANVRRNAAYVLSQVLVKPPEALEALLTVLGNDSAAPVRKMSAKALSLREAPERGFVPSLLGALRQSRNEAVREAALDLLAKNNPPREQLEAALLDCLGDSDVRIRREALGYLRRIHPRSHAALPALGHAQKDSDPTVRCLSAIELVDMGSPDRVAVHLLARDLASSSEDFPCAENALAIAGHFNPEVVPALMHLLQGKEIETRRRAATVLMQLGARARRAIPALAQAKTEDVPGADSALKAIRDSLHSVKTRR